MPAARSAPGRDPARSPLLVPLTLVTGEEELLVSREVAAVVAAARAADAQADVRDLAPDEVDLGDLLDLLSPSLFGSLRVVVLRAAHELPKEVAEAIAAYAADPEPEIVLVAVHGGGARGKALAEALRRAGARTVDHPARRWPEARLAFLQEEVRASGRTVTPEALTALLDAVAPDLRELATALEQLLADNPGDVLDEDAVLLRHRGRSAESGFAVAERALAGDAVGALELVRGGLASGFVDPKFVVKPEGVPVVTTSAVAGALRDLAAVLEAPPGPPQQVAQHTGIPVFRVKRALAQSRGWQPEEVRRAAAAVARADVEVKGGAADAAFALERAVLAVVAARGTGPAGPGPGPGRAARPRR